MDSERFSASLTQIAPMHKPEADQHWKDFAAECVKSEQFVNFEVMEDKTLAAEKWLDAFCDAFLAVKKGLGEKAAESIINLSCEHGCLYPGEMMQAAVYLENGGDSKQIFPMIESGDIDPENLFRPMSRQKAEKYLSEAGIEIKKSVMEQLKSQPRAEQKKTAPKKSAEREL
ncbi:hypothetical protein D7V91_08920 [bacterium 1xD42-67]|nr:hypothetical protein D7V91_08920 [bacterium 1xD42-67]